MDEMVDVLTETGKFTDNVEMKQLCHKKGLWHKAVAVFIINSKN